jgi:2-polyprenyl-3-methyl-5-hydroxy-6-metoxy-1,4-benzoquinol methylase
MSIDDSVQEWYAKYLFPKMDHTNLSAEQWKEIYDNGGFGGQGSGTGSLLENNYELIKIFDNFILENNIQNLLDLGCGAMQWMPFTKTYEKLDYTGVDGASNIVKTNIEKFSSPTKKFICCDLFKFECEDEFDLILCKDVFQHNQMQELKDGLVQKIKSLKSKYKMIILPTGYNFPYECIKPGYHEFDYQSDEPKTVIIF